jgi:hypothetical protein
MTPAQTETYLVLSDGWIAGAFLRRNDLVRLTPAQAQFENVRLIAETERPVPARARPRKSRRQS